jgi:hypothetical protein
VRTCKERTFGFRGLEKDRLTAAYIENLNRILPKGEFLPVPFMSRLTFAAPVARQA